MRRRLGRPRERGRGTRDGVHRRIPGAHLDAARPGAVRAAPPPHPGTAPRRRLPSAAPQPGRHARARDRALARGHRARHGLRAVRDRPAPGGERIGARRGAVRLGQRVRTRGDRLGRRPRPRVRGRHPAAGRLERRRRPRGGRPPPHTGWTPPSHPRDPGPACGVDGDRRDRRDRGRPARDRAVRPDGPVEPAAGRARDFPHLPRLRDAADLARHQARVRALGARRRTTTARRGCATRVAPHARAVLAHLRYPDPVLGDDLDRHDARGGARATARQLAREHRGGQRRHGRLPRGDARGRRRGLAHRLGHRGDRARRDHLDRRPALPRRADASRGSRPDARAIHGAASPHHALRPGRTRPVSPARRDPCVAAARDADRRHAGVGMGMTWATARGLLAVPFDTPLDPDREEARRLLREELAKARYQEREAAETPQWLKDFYEWLQDLLNSLGGEGTVPGWIVLLVIVALAVVVVAFLVFGVPRLRARSRVGATGDELFEADDHRDAAAMRRDAEAAARAGRWDEAIAERFRAIARSLHERTLVSTVPGSTAHDVARRAAAPLPEHAVALEVAAHDFDAVRYLGDPGDRARYETLAALDTAVQRTRPVLEPVATAAGDEPFARVEP